jgi:hypothetical protein
VIKGSNGNIIYVSKLYEGTVSDYQILKSEFAIHLGWFKDHEVRIDLGFEGFEKDYPCRKMRKPHKRKRVPKGQSNALTDQQIAHNKKVASERIAVEHCIGKMKQVRFIQQTLRVHRLLTLDKIIGIAAGLANFKTN